MKSPLIYLTAVKLKNQLKGVFKSPAKLIYGIFLIAMIALVGFSGSLEEAELPEGHAFRDISELTAILVLFYSVMFLMVFVNGSAGSTPMFTLSDVTLLFPSPLSPNRILFYGLFRQLGLSLLLGFFLLFQYSWIHPQYGISYGGLLLVVLGYGITLFLAQFCAMAVYTRTSGRENAKTIIKISVYGAAVLYLLMAAFTCREPLLALAAGKGDFQALLSSGAAFFSTVPGLLFPISGWAAGLTGALLQADFSGAALFLTLILLMFAALVLLIVKAKTNYYEDVLQTAETAQSAITAKKEGQFSEVVPKRVKVGKVGLNKGWGASAIYCKHRVENRRSGIFCLSTMSLIFAAVIIGFSFFMRAIDDGEGGMLIGVFAMGAYMQLFSTALGRFSLELTKPYIYLIPEPPLKKLLYTLKESLISDCLEALVIFVPVGFILGASPVDIAFCIVARVSFALLFTAGNVLVERVFGTVSSKALIFFFYFLVLLLMSIPGIAAGVILMLLLEDVLGMAGLFLGMAMVNAGVSVLALFLCRNLLQYAELNQR